MLKAVYLLPVLCVLIGYSGAALAQHMVWKNCPDGANKRCVPPAQIQCNRNQDSDCNGTVCVCVDLPPIQP